VYMSTNSQQQLTGEHGRHGLSAFIQVVCPVDKPFSRAEDSNFEATLGYQHV